jgi:predicted GNAT family acetyltransferase
MHRITATDDAALDRPVWSALASGHRALAQGGPLARRYPVAMAPFAAIAESTPAAFAALRELIPDEGQVALFTTGEVVAPAGFRLTPVGAVHQMVATAAVAEAADAIVPAVVPLGAADAPEMLRLAELTKPGPFGPRTHELGAFVGIRSGGALVAMAGERMRLDGWVEASGICVHPDHRGHGYARLLARAVMQGIVQRGARAFLHVFLDNAAAIALYRQLGFEVRQRLLVTRIGRGSTSPH